MSPISRRVCALLAALTVFAAPVFMAQGFMAQAFITQARAEKPGGTLRVANSANPSSMSIHFLMDMCSQTGVDFHVR